jgi:hypothetical protein
MVALGAGLAADVAPLSYPSASAAHLGIVFEADCGDARRREMEDRG